MGSGSTPRESVAQAAEWLGKMLAAGLKPDVRTPRAPQNLAHPSDPWPRPARPHPRRGGRRRRRRAGGCPGAGRGGDYLPGAQDLLVGGQQSRAQLA